MSNLDLQMLCDVDADRLNGSDLLHLDMALRGCVSGRLREWPGLGAAFRRVGLEASPTMESSAMRDISKLILKLHAKSE